LHPLTSLRKVQSIAMTLVGEHLASTGHIEA
jgi:hypothetical protein